MDSLDESRRWLTSGGARLAADQSAGGGSSGGPTTAPGARTVVRLPATRSQWMAMSQQLAVDLNDARMWAETIQSIAISALMVLAFVAAAVLMWQVWRSRRQDVLRLTQARDTSGHDDLAVAAGSFSARFAEELVAQLEAVGRQVELRAAKSGIRHDDRAPLPADVAADADIEELIAAVATLAPKEAQASVQLLQSVLLRPRGIEVQMSFVRRSNGPGGLGVSWSQRDLRGKRPPRMITVWESEGTDGEDVIARVDAIIPVACRIAAIEVTRWRLQPVGRHSDDGGPADGLVENFVAMMYQASMRTYPSFEHQLLSRAKADFDRGVGLRPQDSRIRENRGDAFLRSAEISTEGDRLTALRAAAVDYSEALALVASSRDPAMASGRAAVDRRTENLGLAAGVERHDDEVRLRASRFLACQLLDDQIATSTTTEDLRVLRDVDPTASHYQPRTLYQLACVFERIGEGGSKHAQFVLACCLGRDLPHLGFLRSAQADPDLSQTSAGIEPFVSALRLQELEAPDISRLDHARFHSEISRIIADAHWGQHEPPVVR